MNKLFQLLIIVATLLAPPPPTVVSAECPDTLTQSLIYQPWLDDAKQADLVWKERFNALHTKGISTLLLQWTGYGDTDFLTKPDSEEQQSTSFIGRLLTLASTHEIKIIFGLWSDPDWFSHVNEDDQALTFYLRRLRERNRNQALKIFEQFGNHPSFAGWYLPEEIDDRHWQTTTRQQLLQEHLLLMSKMLGQFTEQYPVMISSYFSGGTTPDFYAEMKKMQQKESGIIWLFQDGLGTNRLTNYQTGIYLRALAKQGKENGLKWEGILEIFSESQENSGFVSASNSDIEDRKKTWCEYAGSLPRFIFSLKYLF